VGTIRQTKRLAEWQPEKLIQRVAKRSGQLYRQDLMVQLGKICHLPKAQYKAIQHNIDAITGLLRKKVQPQERYKQFGLELNLAVPPVKA